MVQINPLRALRPSAEKSAELVSLPYDVMDRAEARKMAEDKVASYLRIIRSDLEFGDEIDPYSDEIYKRAENNLQLFQDKGWLIRESEPCYYIYRLNSKEIQQTGLVAGSAIQDYAADRIKKHEFTRPEKELDRTTHIDRLGANTGPVFLLYRSKEQPRIAELMDGIADSRTPLYDLTFEDGVRHRLYKVAPGTEQDEIGLLFKNLEATYIADGHHRAASAWKNGVKRAETKEGAQKSDPHNFFLTVTFPDDQLAILPYNRAVKDLAGLSVEDLIHRIEENFKVLKTRDDINGPYHINMFLEGNWYALQALPHTYAGMDARDGLAVSVLQNRVLAPLLGIDDPRTSDRIKFVGGIRGDEELERLVNSGQFEVAFSMPPVSSEQLIQIADAGSTMPPKSTWFEPKLRSGFVTHLLDK